MDIIENRADWEAQFKAGWLAHLEETNSFDWKKYKYVSNKSAEGNSGIDLSQSKLMLISSAGGYLADSQEPFFDNDDTHPTGDFSIRVLPQSTELSDISYAHSHYDHTAVNADAQVLIPLRHLEAMVEEGKIGSLADSVVSFMGFQPDARRTVDELIPAVLEVVEAEKPDAVLLVPS